MTHVAWLKDVDLSNIASVGGKNASLGELIRELEPQGIRVPDGFAVSARAFRLHLEHSALGASIYSALASLDVRDVELFPPTLRAYQVIEQ